MIKKKNPMSKKAKITTGFIVFCLVIGGGYFGKLVLQSMATGVSIKNLNEHKKLSKKRMNGEKF